QVKDKKNFVKLLSLFLVVFFSTQLPLYIFNFVRYHTPLVTGPAIGEFIDKGVYVSPLVAIFSSLWGFRHIFMHFSGFLGWNEAFPFPPIFIIYTVLFILFSCIGVVSAWKNNKSIDRLMIISIAFLLLLFLSLDTIRKVYSHQ